MTTELIAWLCSGSVGAVFVFAGVTKIALGPDWQVQARNLGVPQITVRFVRLVPWLEIVIGLGLIARVFSGVINTVALIMLMSFTALIVGQLMHGRRPPCACFGRRSTRPIGWSNVIRNMVLATLILVATFV
ncbi:MAG: MauE/DoxX family redox-associated membrane protein [Ilumatobacteraceae bacterium]